MAVKQIIKNHVINAIRTIGLDIKRYKPSFNPRCVSLHPKDVSRGRVLLAYILDPFLLKKGEKESSVHEHHLESRLIADAFLDFGYSVDVIDYRNRDFTPSNRYDIFVSARSHFDILEQRLNKDCIKIAHLDTAHFAFNNHAAYKRALDLQNRRHATCTNFRVIEHNMALERADYTVLIGGTFNVSTHKYAGKPLFPIPVLTVTTYPYPRHKDFSLCKNRFLYFSSGGLVHKGLDLVLEAFVEMPDFHLTVCGPIEKEKNFENIFYNELHNTKNIEIAGWVDVTSDRFIEITNNCVGLVYPSCSESQSGAVAICLQAGLVPILSTESGFDVEDFGITLKESLIHEIQDKVKTVSTLPTDRLAKMSRSAWEYARANHTREAYAKRYREIVEHILNDAGKLND